jgi:hypothetical protein
LIDRWVTVIETDIPFTASDYRSIYESHIQKPEDNTQPYNTLDNIPVHLHNLGWCVPWFSLIVVGLGHLIFHSGTQPITAVDTSALSKTDVNAAIQEYMDEEETETDSETVMSRCVSHPE